MKDIDLRLWGRIVLFWLIMCVVCSCQSVKYVPVETVKTEVQYKDRLQRDSIHIRDSVYLQVKGDTIYLYKYKYVYKGRIVRDTAYIELRDSIQVPYPVEKQLSRWQSIKLELGGWAFGIIILFALIIIGWLVYKKRKK